MSVEASTNGKSAPRATPTRRASKVNALRNGTDLSLVQQERWLISRISDLEGLLNTHRWELEQTVAEINSRKAVGTWKPPTQKEE